MENIFYHKSSSEVEVYRARIAKLSETEADLSEHFLGADFSEIVRAGSAAGDAVFVAGAALPLDQRTRCFREWRKRVCLELVAEHECGAYFLATVEPEFAGRVQAGECEFQDLARKLDAVYDAHVSDVKARARAAGRRVIDSCRAAVHDLRHPEQYDPRGGVILATGESRLFASLSAAETWGQQAGCRYLVFECSHPRILRGTSPD